MDFGRISIKKKEWKTRKERSVVPRIETTSINQKNTKLAMSHREKSLQRNLAVALKKMTILEPESKIAELKYGM
jgi:hypothetical protein